jgi:hypothetical protein
MMLDGGDFTRLLIDRGVTAGGSEGERPCRTRGGETRSRAMPGAVGAAR